MTVKRAITVLLLLFVAASLGAMVAGSVRARRRAASGGGDVLPTADGVTVCYFHGTERCTSCLNMEAFTKATLEEGFADELRTGWLRFRSIDYEKPGNGHFVEDYQVAGPTVVLVEHAAGEQTQWKNLQDVCYYTSDREGMIEYVDGELRHFIAGSEPPWYEQSAGVFSLAAAAALWLGLVTSVSPCPMATNIAAISYVGRRVGSTRQVLLSGALYTAGRTAVYLVLGVALVAGLLSIPQLSLFLQKTMNKLLGPILIVVALFLLELVRVRFGAGGVSERLQRRVDAWGIWGAGLLGIVFALSFCPISAAWFFGSLVPLSLSTGSSVLLPSLYGVGTAVPVIGFAVLIALSAKGVGTAFNRLGQIEWWARRVTGGVFLAVGIFLSLEYCFGLPL